jgi:hypothetical protein
MENRANRVIAVSDKRISSLLQNLTKSAVLQQRTTMREAPDLTALRPSQRTQMAPFSG